MANWYTFTIVNGADPCNPVNYNHAQSNRPLCQGYRRYCAILSDDDNFGHPIITQAILEDMARAMQFGSNQSNVILRS